MFSIVTLAMLVFRFTLKQQYVQSSLIHGRVTFRLLPTFNIAEQMCSVVQSKCSLRLTEA